MDDTDETLYCTCQTCDAWWKYHNPGFEVCMYRHQPVNEGSEYVGSTWDACVHVNDGPPFKNAHECDGGEGVCWQRHADMCLCGFLMYGWFVVLGRWAHIMEEACISCVDGGKMTKDLAVCIHGLKKWVRHSRQCLSRWLCSPALLMVMVFSLVISFQGPLLKFVLHIAGVLREGIVMGMVGQLQFCCQGVAFPPSRHIYFIIFLIHCATSELRLFFKMWLYDDHGHSPFEILFLRQFFSFAMVKSYGVVKAIITQSWDVFIHLQVVKISLYLNRHHLYDLSFFSFFSSHLSSPLYFFEYRGFAVNFDTSLIVSSFMTQWHTIIMYNYGM